MIPGSIQTASPIIPKGCQIWRPHGIGLGDPYRILGSYQVFHLPYLTLFRARGLDLTPLQFSGCGKKLSVWLIWNFLTFPKLLLESVAVIQSRVKLIRMLPNLTERNVSDQLEFVICKKDFTVPMHLPNY